MDDVKLAPKPPQVNAFRGILWRCLDKNCGLVQVATRSITHEADCKRCGKLFTVHVRQYYTETTQRPSNDSPPAS